MNGWRFCWWMDERDTKVAQVSDDIHYVNRTSMFLFCSNNAYGFFLFFLGVKILLAIGHLDNEQRINTKTIPIIVFHMRPNVRYHLPPPPPPTSNIVEEQRTHNHAQAHRYIPTERAEPYVLCDKYAAGLIRIGREKKYDDALPEATPNHLIILHKCYNESYTIFFPAVECVANDKRQPPHNTQ